VLVAKLAARLSVLGNLRSARVTRANLAWCFPHLDEPALTRLTLASLGETAQLLLESGIIFHGSEADLEKLTVSVQGAQMLEEALRSRRGVLLLVPHFGNWEFLALHLGRYRLVALYDPPRNKSIHSSLKQARERTGVKMVALDQQGLRIAYRTLQQGGLLGILPDQVPERRAGVYAPLFDRPALTMTLVHRLAARFSPVIVMGSAVRTRQGFEIRLKPLDDALSNSDPESALSSMNQNIEELIMQQPAQYQWEYKRFKAPPDEEARIY
jgi:KDO2-lipid IV(A) lauroyltransferase